MFKTLRNAWTIPELRRKILFTLFIVFLYRVGAAIPVPFIDYQAMQTTAAWYSEGILSYLNILSGYAFSKATLLALSVTRYHAVHFGIDYHAASHDRDSRARENVEER